MTVSAAITLVIVTVLDRYLAYYKDDDPKVTKFLRFLIDLISVLPSKGHSLARGLQLPLISTSGKPSDEKKPGGISLYMVLAVLLFVGCGHSPVKTVEIMRQATDGIAEQIPKFCGDGGSKFAGDCADGDKQACDRFEQCYTATKIMESLHVAILGAFVAIAAGKSDDVVEASITAASKTLVNLLNSLRTWGIIPLP